MRKTYVFRCGAELRATMCFSMAWGATIENSQTLQASKFQQTHISSTYLARNPDHTTPINMAEYMPILDEGPKPITDQTHTLLVDPTKWLFHTLSSSCNSGAWMSDNKNASPDRHVQRWSSSLVVFPRFLSSRRCFHTHVVGEFVGIL